uniref:Uncharacterized protein n=1 Tax=Arion vulgaris TaxID=1028688 RepID=A0A0B6Y1T2_9EUPU
MLSMDSRVEEREITECEMRCLRKMINITKSERIRSTDIIKIVGGSDSEVDNTLR